MSEALLSNKRALLSSLGSSYNDLYYSSASASVSAVECTFAWQNVISVPTLQFGGSSTVNIPIDQFVQSVVLHLRLPPHNSANTAVCQGWGPAMIESIAYTIGASSSTQIVLQGDSILQTLMGQCNTKEKRNAVLSLAGQFSAGTDPATDLDAYFVLPLPFSTMCQEKLPIDSTLLSNSISVTINFKQARAIYSYTAAGASPLPSAFAVAEVLLRQGKLSSQSASIRSEMIAQPDLIYHYPFTHAQRFISASFTGSTGFQACSVQLNQFQNADLLGIMFWVVQDNYKVPPGTDNQTPNPWLIDPISNILVSFNGSTLFNFPAKSHRLCGMLAGDQNDPSYDIAKVDNRAPPQQLTSETCWPVFLDFSRERAICMHDHMFNTFRIPNQNILVQFSTSVPDVQYKLYATYFYNGAIEFQSGTSAVYIG